MVGPGLTMKIFQDFRRNFHRFMCDLDWRNPEPLCLSVGLSDTTFSTFKLQVDLRSLPPGIESTRPDENTPR